MHTDTGTDTEVKTSSNLSPIYLDNKIPSVPDLPDILLQSSDKQIRRDENVLNIDSNLLSDNPNKSSDNFSVNSTDFDSAESSFEPEHFIENVAYEKPRLKSENSSNSSDVCTDDANKYKNPSASVNNNNISTINRNALSKSATVGNIGASKITRNFVLPPRENRKSFGKEFIPAFKTQEPEPLLIIKRTPSKLNLPKEVGKPKVAVTKNISEAKKYFGEYKKPEIPKPILRRSETLKTNPTLILTKQNSLPEKNLDTKTKDETPFNFDPLDADLKDIDNYIENLIANEDELMKPIDPDKYKTKEETPPPPPELSSSIEDLLRALETETKVDEALVLNEPKEKIDDLLSWMEELDHTPSDRKVYRSLSDVKYKNLEHVLKTPKSSVISKLPKDNITYFEKYLSGKKVDIPDEQDETEEQFKLTRSKTDVYCNKSRGSVDLDALAKVNIKKVLQKFESIDYDQEKKETKPLPSSVKRQSIGSFRFSKFLESFEKGEVKNERGDEMKNKITPRRFINKRNTLSFFGSRPELVNAVQDRKDFDTSKQVAEKVVQKINVEKKETSSESSSYEDDSTDSEDEVEVDTKQTKLEEEKIFKTRNSSDSKLESNPLYVKTSESFTTKTNHDQLLKKESIENKPQCLEKKDSLTESDSSSDHLNEKEKERSNTSSQDDSSSEMSFDAKVQTQLNQIPEKSNEIKKNEMFEENTAATKSIQDYTSESSSSEEINQNPCKMEKEESNSSSQEDSSFEASSKEKVQNQHNKTVESSESSESCSLKSNEIKNDETLVNVENKETETRKSTQDYPSESSSSSDEKVELPHETPKNSDSISSSSNSSNQSDENDSSLKESEVQILNNNDSTSKVFNVQVPKTNDSVSSSSNISSTSPNMSKEEVLRNNSTSSESSDSQDERKNENLYDFSIKQTNDEDDEEETYSESSSEENRDDFAGTSHASSSENNSNHISLERDSSNSQIASKIIVGSKNISSESSEEKSAAKNISQIHCSDESSASSSNCSSELLKKLPVDGSSQIPSLIKDKSRNPQLIKARAGCLKDEGENKIMSVPSVSESSSLNTKLKTFEHQQKNDDVSSLYAKVNKLPKSVDPMKSSTYSPPVPRRTKKINKSNPQMLTRQKSYEETIDLKLPPLPPKLKSAESSPIMNRRKDATPIPPQRKKSNNVSSTQKPNQTPKNQKEIVTTYTLPTLQRVELHNELPTASNYNRHMSHDGIKHPNAQNDKECCIQ